MLSQLITMLLVAFPAWNSMAAADAVLCHGWLCIVSSAWLPKTSLAVHASSLQQHLKPVGHKSGLQVWLDAPQPRPAPVMAYDAEQSQPVSAGEPGQHCSSSGSPGVEPGTAD